MKIHYLFYQFMIVSFLAMVSGRIVKYFNKYKNATFECPGNPLMWKRQENLSVIIIYQNQNVTPDLSDRFIVSGKSLNIISINERDVGVNTCTATNPWRIHEIRVELFRPPTDIEVLEASATGIILGIEGKHLRMTCIVNPGYPHGTLELKSGNEILQKVDTPRLDFMLIPTVNDSGKFFTCVANNTLGQIQMTILLKLTVKPKVAIVQPLTLIEGMNTNMICSDVSINSNLMVNFTWTFKGDKLPIKKSRLHFQNINRTKSGIYTCVIENSAGRGVADYYLDILYPPRVISREVVLNPNESNYTLVCAVENGNPASTTFGSWNRTSYCDNSIGELIEETNGWLQLYSMGHIHLQDYCGKYTCAAKNSIRNKRGELWQYGEITVKIRADPVEPDILTLMVESSYADIKLKSVGTCMGKSMTLSVQYRQSTTISWRSISFHRSTCESLWLLHIDDLHPKTNYDIKIKAINEFGESPFVYRSILTKSSENKTEASLGVEHVVIIIAVIVVMSVAVASFAYKIHEIKDYILNSNRRNAGLNQADGQHSIDNQANQSFGVLDVPSLNRMANDDEDDINRTEWSIAEPDDGFLRRTGELNYIEIDFSGQCTSGRQRNASVKETPYAEIDFTIHDNSY